MKIIKSKWFPYNPYPCLAIGTKLINYFILNEEYYILGDKGVKKLLDSKGFKHPCYCRSIITKFKDNSVLKGTEFLTIL